MFNYKRLLVVSLISIFIVSACTKESSTTENINVTTKEKIIQNILDKVQDKSKNSGKSYSFVIAYNKQQNNYWLQEITELDESHIKGPSAAYQVDCYSGDGDLLWSETFDDRDAAGTAIIICTDEGGCAEVCQVHARYYHSN